MTIPRRQCFEGYVITNRRVGIPNSLRCSMALTYPLIILINYAPESPWFLSQKGCVEEATSVIIRIQKKGSKVDDLQDTIAMMIRTDGHEKMVSAGTTYWDCFKGSYLR
ncbi:uncharacterized protein EHS24_001830 [Apiotrichum porosum]|uniref:Major facilitator superfamily (MFS) profile domain-containing protein n=1 Tax=Apiotrichum porosum TaxID=105984 RepID=A0A427XJI7_9TREE|nr:uncharacterized protein EHS24_001830 [Apiotrichum porosum]RSH78907.1 hypothetical protein EHS24_001830 [Apiotrichum porosum]